MLSSSFADEFQMTSDLRKDFFMSNETIDDSEDNGQRNEIKLLNLKEDLSVIKNRLNNIDDLLEERLLYPIFRALALLYDSVWGHYCQLNEYSNKLDDSAKDKFVIIESILNRHYLPIMEELSDVLQLLGIVNIPVKENTIFDPRYHRPEEVIFTTDAELNQVVHGVIRAGFMFEKTGKVIRPASIVVYRFNEKGE